jgi:aryl-alcohol dehydrogenase-like predicted oxidoreductase
MTASGLNNTRERVAAAITILDRGYGKATQLIAGDEERGPVHSRFERASARWPLAWLMARPSVTARIGSATSLEQLHELKLDRHDADSLNAASG